MGSSHDCFAGGGEMGERMRAFDWSATPLGPVDGWPQSLRTVVSLCLRSRFTLWIGWGPALTYFYNDAYRPVLKAKHPWALGRPALEVWAEVEDLIGPMLRGVLATGEATWATDQLMLLDRNGYLEETYFTFSYSPILDESGGVGGVLTTLVETTEQVVGTRRMRALRELGARTQDARTVDETVELAVAVLEESAADLPFCRVYLRDGRGPGVRLAGMTGPRTVDPARWPFDRVAAGRGELVNDLPPDVDRDLACATFVAPLAASEGAAPFGFLVAGTSPKRPFDEGYRGFLELTAAGLASALARARAQEAARSRAEALTELDRAKTEFFSNVSHELRTPLTLLLGPLEDAMLSGDLALSEETIGSMHRSARRLLRMVNALLDISRLEAGRAKAAFAPVDLAAQTADAVSVFRSAFEEAGIALSVDCAAMPEPVWVDRDQWEKIVVNLVSNAFKFTFQGSVRVALSAEGDHAVLRVEDTGIGIPAAELPRVFDRFHRVEGARARTHEGTGIGLSLVRELCRTHDGTVGVESAEGRGSVFTVRVPLAARGTAGAPSSRRGRRASRDALFFGEEARRWLPVPIPSSKTERRLAAARVLVAEDNVDMRDYLVRVLRAAKLEVHACADGTSALAAAVAAPPDLVLTDVTMPGIDGFDLLKALRADARTQGVPVLLLSARAGEEARVEGFDAGADDYLIKPFSARELVARVGACVELSRLRRGAEAERDRLRTLLAHVPAMVSFLRGPDLVYELANPLLSEVLGCGDLVGRPLRDAFPEGARAPFLGVIREVYETGRVISRRDQGIRLDAGAPGGPRDTYWNATYLPVRDARGAIEGVMGFHVDVTEQVVAREALRRIQATLEEESRRKDEFLALLGHELRNPLAPMRMATSLIDTKLPAGDPLRRYVQILDRQVATLARLVDDLLDVSRITRGSIELRREAIDVRLVVQRAFEVVRAQVEQRRHRVRLASILEPVPVVGDPVRLEQIVVNLLNNATKYTDPGGRIDLSVVREGKRVVIRVKDSGIGIAPDMLERVFELFEQAGRGLDRSQGGLGVGLTVVKSLVELHGGTVEALSEGIGKGAELIVRLPVAASVAVPAREASPRAPAQAKPAERRRVLVVDDNAHAAETLSAMLADTGHEVTVAADGPAALRIFGEKDLDLVILDIGLPGMDGFEVARRLRRSAAGDKPFLVALTGYGGAAYRDRAIEAGFDMHLLKPVSVDALEQLLSGAARRAS